jgi:hypothetical protein
VSLSRISWSLTVIACLITGAIMQLDGYSRYPAVALAVAAAAAINLL